MRTAYRSAFNILLPLLRGLWSLTRLLMRLG